MLKSHLLLVRYVLGENRNNHSSLIKVNSESHLCNFYRWDVKMCFWWLGLLQILKLSKDETLAICFGLPRFENVQVNESFTFCPGLPRIYRFSVPVWGPASPRSTLIHACPDEKQRLIIESLLKLILCSCLTLKELGVNVRVRSWGLRLG